MSMLIEGKTLQQLCDTLPAGDFEKLVRKQLDPLYGKGESDMHYYKVKVRYYFSGSSTHTMEVEATSPEHAKRVARESFANEILDFDCSSDAEVSDVDIDEVEKLDGVYEG